MITNRLLKIAITQFCLRHYNRLITKISMLENSTVDDRIDYCMFYFKTDENKEYEIRVTDNSCDIKEVQYD